MAQSLRSLILRLLLTSMRVFPVNPRKVLFMSYYGKYYNDNPRAICEQLHQDHPELELVWGLEEGVAHPDYVRSVRPSSFAFVKELATAKVWVDNSRKREWVTKRKGQFYLQTWHGNLGNKKIEKAAEDKLMPEYVRRAKQDGANTDLMISGSRFFTNLCQTIFWYNGPVLECGTPRLDVFYHFSEADRARVRQSLGLQEGQRLILYAPTFRQDLSVEPYLFDYEKLLSTLEEKAAKANGVASGANSADVIAAAAGEYILGIRLHPNVPKDPSMFQSSKVKDMTDYPDLYELILTADMILSDYSSLVFEAGLIEKPVLLYAPDLEAYEKERGGYWSFKELPFPLAQSEEELMALVRDFDYDKYVKDLRAFYETLGNKEDGSATRKVAEVLYQVTQRGARPVLAAIAAEETGGGNRPEDCAPDQQDDRPAPAGGGSAAGGAHE